MPLTKRNTWTSCPLPWEVLPGAVQPGVEFRTCFQVKFCCALLNLPRLRIVSARISPVPIFLIRKYVTDVYTSWGCDRGCNEKYYDKRFVQFQLNKIQLKMNKEPYILFLAAQLAPQCSTVEWEMSDKWLTSKITLWMLLKTFPVNHVFKVTNWANNWNDHFLALQSSLKSLYSEND